MMKKTKSEIEKLKKQYPILKAKGLNQKEIAQQLGVSEKTISQWTKSLPTAHFYTIQKGLQKRLIKMLANPETPIMDIYNISNALTGIQKIIEKNEKPYQNRIN